MSGPDRLAGATHAQIDLARLREVAGGDADLLRDLVVEYIAFMPGELQALGEALPAGDAGRIREVAHRAAGANAACGFTVLHELLNQIESLAASGTVEGVDGHLARATTEFARITPALDALLVIVRIAD